MVDRNAELPRNPFNVFPSDISIEDDPEKLLNDPFTQSLISRPGDPDFDAFCEYIGLNRSRDTHS